MDDIENIFENADELTQEVGEKALEITRSKPAQLFRKAYGEYFEIQPLINTFARVFANAFKQDNENEFEKILESKASIPYEVLYANLAIVQAALKKTKEGGKNREDLLAQARRCAAVHNSIQMNRINPKIAMLFPAAPTAVAIPTSSDDASNPVATCTIVPKPKRQKFLKT